MLSALDDSLMHQSAEVFAHTAESDHRFFDRTVFGLQSPDGDLGLVTSFGVYKNSNVMDGFAMLQRDSVKQFNHRYSRRLDLDYEEVALGPLSLEILEPLKHARIQLQPGNYAASYDIEWNSVLPPHLEKRHYLRHGGRIVRDHLRFSQFATATGWIEVEGKRVNFKDWFSWRDHSWGVRPGVGGFEPFNGGLESDKGYLGIYIWWLTDDAGALFQVQEDGDGNRLYIDGNITSRVGKPTQHIVDAKHDFTFHPGTRRFKTGTLEVKTADGETHIVEIESVGRPWAYKGSGYDHGYHDEKGLGFFRGDWLEEYDSYDLSHVEDVVLPGGKVIRPVHREQIARVKVNGKPGFAHTPVISNGPNKRYGFTGAAEVSPG